MRKGMTEEGAMPGIDIGEIEIIHGGLNASEFRFGIVVSRFNGELTGQLLKSAVDCLRQHGAAEENIKVVWVPGAYEIPAIVDKLTGSGEFDAVIALGCVIEGETPHAGLINTAVASELVEIARDFGVPVINEVVGTYTEEQAIIRCEYGEESRGWYAATAAVEMAAVSEACRKRFESDEEDEL